jgi:enolase
MEIKRVYAKVVKDSRKENTIQVILKTTKGLFKTSAPSGKSKGRFEVKSYANGLKSDIKIINTLDLSKLNGLLINKFEDLKKLEKEVYKKIGGNSLFALEACILKALAKENKKELWEFLGGKKVPHPVGNSIGGGLHSKGKKGLKPDFQEFLFVSDCKTFKRCVQINLVAYKMAKKMLKTGVRNDEGAWETGKTNEEVLEIMNEIQIKIREKYKEWVEIGLDVAASSFYNGNYNYKNPGKRLNKFNQILYIRSLIRRYGIFYVEDPLYETDMTGFANLNREKCFIVGDDLIATSPERLKKAMRFKAINAVIVKPNQIGSLLKVKEVVDLCKARGIKTIISHRSGETTDNTIADLGVGFGCDFIKTGIYGPVRESKLRRLIEIEKKLKNQNN